MARIKITQAAAEKLSPPAAGQADYFDAILPGFGLRVAASGRKVWFVMYRVGGKQKRFTIGTMAVIDKVEAARARARGLLEGVGRGIDPAEARDAPPAPPPAPPLTFRTLAGQFVERHCKRRNRAWKGTERIFANHVFPTWGDRAAASITRGDVRKLLDDLGDELPVGVNRVLAAIRKCFNWAMEVGLLDAAPTDKVKAPAPETARDRVLTDAELAAVWRAAEGLPAPARGFVRLLVLTGQRRTEAASARWANVDIDKAVWTIPAAASKNTLAHEVPLSAMAVEVLADLPRVGTFCFTQRHIARRCGAEVDGGPVVGADVPLSGYSKVKAAVDEAIAESGAAVSPWTWHDLRRTAATGMARLRVPRHTISKVLNHSEGGVTRIYDRYAYGDEKRAALDAWARHVESLVRPAPDNVVALRRA